MLFVAGAIAFGYSYIYADVYLERYLALCGNSAKIEAVCLKTDYVSNYSSTYEIKITEIDGERVNLKAILSADYNLDINAGEKITGEVTFLALSENENYEGEYENRFGKGNILYALAEVGDTTADSCEVSGKIRYIGKAGFDIKLYLSKLNEKCDRVLKNFLESDSAALVSALLLGNREGLSSTVKRDFRRLGLSHLLAVSGLHLSILTASFVLFLRRFGLKKYITDFLAVLVAVFFMGITGFSASVVRAALMLVTSTVFGFFRIRISAFNSLLLTVTVIIIFSPYAVYDISLILSFFATFGILIMAPGFGRLFTTLGAKSFSTSSLMRIKLRAALMYVMQGICTGISAMIFTLPVMWLYFGEISLLSPITTVVFTPLVWMLIVLGCLTIILSPISAVLSIVSVPSGIADIFCALMREAADKLSQLRGITVSLRYDFTIPIFLCFAAAVIILLKIKVKSPFNVLIPFGALAVVFISSVILYENISSGYVYTEYINIGKNDGFAVISDSRALICDISDGSSAIFREAAELIQKNYYCTEIEAYMITHYHKRHISNFEKFASANIIRRLILPNPINEKEEEIFSMLAESARIHGCETVFFDREKDAVQFGKAEIAFTEYGYLKRSTHPIIGLSISANDDTLLYIGSSAFEYNDDMNGYGIYEAEHIVFGMHGPILKKISQLGAVEADIIFANIGIVDYYEVNGSEAYGNFSVKIRAKA